MKRMIFIGALCAASFAAHAQQQSAADLANQVSAVQNAVSAQQAQEQAERDAAHAKAAAEREAQQQTQERAEREQERQATITAAKDAKRRAAAQDFIDKERQLQVEREEVDLQVRKAEAARANDEINANLARQKAKTDAIQADADSERTVAQGVKHNLDTAHCRWYESCH